MSGHHIPQSRAHYAPTQFPLYHSPYYNHSLRIGYDTPFELGTQAVTDPRLRTPATMPNFSSLTNSALVDALLTPSIDEQQEQQKEQNTILSPPDVSNLTGASKKRLHHTVNPVGEQLHPTEDDNTSILEPDNGSRPRKKPKKQQKRRSIASIELDDEYVEKDHSDSFESVQERRKPRRSTRPKKSPAPNTSTSRHVNVEGQHNDLSDKSENPKKPVTAKKIRKPRANRLIRKKPIGMAVPKTLSEANEADRMMWEWKNAGRNWEEIRTEWKRLTGIEPGGSSLSVRYIKLNENLARNGAAGDIELLRFKKEAEEELMSQLWPKVAEKMLEFSPESEHNPKDLQKRYNMIVRSGYDVEKLVEEDKIKREVEHKGRPPYTATPDEIGLRDGSMTNSAGYEDAVANSTSIFLRQDEVQNSHEDDHQEERREQVSEHTNISEDTSNIFENLGLLQHQVDGLHGPEHYDDLRFESQNCHEIDTFVSDDILASQSPSNKQMRANMATGRLPLTSSLVNYHSDSE